MRPWLHEELPAEPSTVRALRARMRVWIDEAELDEELGESVLLIVDEAVTNAVEHACPGRHCTVALSAGSRPCGSGVAVLVADDGAWRPIGAPGHRGRGLTLMGRLSDRSTVEATESGTSVRMCWDTSLAR